MVFPSVSLYLDPPNWHQAQNDQQAVGTGGGGGRNPSLPPPPPQETHHMGQARPGSMADRARMASIPQPEAGLKCPRCESTNTKFCYFNNYSLLQPRHFCKTCRRYWTRGGALRSVPVGGGCRRNKRSSKRRSSNRSKSPSVSNSQEPPSQQQAQPPQLLVTDNGSGSTRSGVPEMFNMGHNHLPQLEPPHIPFMASLHNFGQYGINENIGLNIGGGMLNQAVPTSAATGGGAGGGGSEQWRLMGQMQQFPFLGGFEQANNLYAFQGDENHQPSVVGEGNLEVKMEENQNHGMNLTSQFPGITSANSEYWGGGNKWVNLSGGLGSSSTGGANMIR